jgi:hypothetical protein
VLIAVNDYFLVAANKEINDTNQMIVFKSLDGETWEEVFHAEATIPKAITIVSGKIAVCATGCVFLADINGANWTKLPLPKEYELAQVISSASTTGTFYFLIKLTDKTMLATTTDGITVSVIDTPWTTESYTMHDNGNQLIVSSRVENQACLVYFSDDITEYKTKLVPISQIESKDFSTVYDIMWHENQWIFACSTEFNNVSGMTFSKAGYVYRCEGELSDISLLEADTITARQLSAIRHADEVLVAYGNAFPTVENFIYLAK